MTIDINATLEEHIRATQDCFSTCEDVYNPGTTTHLTAKLLGGLAYSQSLTALCFLDSQIMDDKVVGFAQDRRYASYGMVRRGSVAAFGQVKVTGEDGTVVQADETLEASGGGDYKITQGGVITGGELLIDVIAKVKGLDGNLFHNQSLTSETYSTLSFNNISVSGGSNVENDMEFRRRRFSLFSPVNAFGGKCSLENRALALPNVTRTWLRGSNTNPLIYVAMDDVYDNSQPDQSDIENYNSTYNDCGATIGVNPSIVGIKAKEILIRLSCSISISSFEVLKSELRTYLVNNAQLGQTLDYDSVACFIRSKVGSVGEIVLLNNSLSDDEIFTTADVSFV